jgi:hypothetical protein
MRTTLDLDDELMERLLRRFPGTSKTRAVERAIEGFLLDHAYEQILALEGAFPDLVDTTAEGDALDLGRQAASDAAWRA